MDEHHINAGIWAGHLASLSVVISTLAGVLPPLGAAVAIIWYLINIMDSRHVQRWTRMRRAVKIGKLKARLEELERLQYEETEKPEG